MKTEKELMQIVKGLSEAISEALQDSDLTMIESSKILLSATGVILSGIGKSFPENCKEEFGEILLTMISMMTHSLIENVINNKNFMQKHIEKVYETLKNKNNNQTIH